MTEYRLITSDAPQGLCEQVCAALSSGFALHGSPGCTPGVNGKGHVYFQAVVK